MNISNTDGAGRDSLRDVLRAAISDAVTVSEAAQILGVTTRAVQRRISSGEIETIEVNGTRLVRLSTPQSDVPQSGAPQSAPAPEPAAPVIPASAPVAAAPAASTPAPANAFADDMAQRYVAQLERENAFLRTQIEAHSRAEAELRTALREALRAMPKALPGSANESAPPAPTPAPIQPVPIQTVVEPAPAQASTPIENSDSAQPPANGAPAVVTSVPVETPRVEPEKSSVEIVPPQAPTPTAEIQSEPIQAAPVYAAPDEKISSAPLVPASEKFEPEKTKAPDEVVTSIPVESAPVKNSVPPVTPEIPEAKKVEPQKAEPTPVAAKPVVAEPAPVEPASTPAPVKFVEPPLRSSAADSKGGYKSVYETRRAARPLWKQLLNMR